MRLNYVVLFEQTPYLLKIQLNHGFQVRFLQISRKGQNYYSLVKQNKISHQFYARFRNFVTNQIRQAKINYFARKFQKIKGYCKSTWKQINSIILPNRINKINIINKISENYIAYVLNSLFQNIGKHISESMTAGPYDHYQYLKGNCANSLFFVPVSSADVEEIILSRRNKLGNINTFSTSVLKRVRRGVSYVLCHIINTLRYYQYSKLSIRYTIINIAYYQYGITVR